MIGCVSAFLTNHGEPLIAFAAMYARTFTTGRQQSTKEQKTLLQKVHWNFTTLLFSLRLCNRQPIDRSKK